MRIKNFAISRIEKQLFCPCRDGSFKESCKIFERQTTEINKIKKTLLFLLIRESIHGRRLTSDLKEIIECMKERKTHGVSFSLF